MITIIGVDPGESAGVAILQEIAPVLIDRPHSRMALIETFQGSPKDAMTLIELMLDRCVIAADEGHVWDDNECIVACERFVSMRRQTAITHQPAAQQMVGAVRSLTERYGMTFIEQGAADAKAIAPNDLLKRIRMLVSKKDVDQPDANDVNMAVRHAILALARKHATLFERLVT